MNSKCDVCYGGSFTMGKTRRTVVEEHGSKKNIPQVLVSETTYRKCDDCGTFFSLNKEIFDYDLDQCLKKKNHGLYVRFTPVDDFITMG
ncbi:MAG: hypothetical protein V3R86_04185 [Candidatus Hydrothermarchaeaceae archaeon]